MTQHGIRKSVKLEFLQFVDLNETKFLEDVNDVSGF